MDTTSSLPRGFFWGAVRAGIKASGRPDLSAIVAPETATAAALYTTNKIQAAPLLIDRRHVAANAARVHTVLINAGNANCATGDVGIAAAEQCCVAAAEVFGCTPEAVFPSSTGIIGVPLPVEKVRDALPALRNALGDTKEHFAAIAGAIMTTDTRPKTAFATVEIHGAPVHIAGIAKGAGMIHPQLAAAPHATMLAYLCSDAAAEPALLQRLLEESAETSFNRISIDGDTSTNDTVLLLASGASGATLTERNSSAFATALAQVCTSLAKQIVADGEGATRLVELNICGAASDADALRVAKAIAHSPLVKTAWAGSDPNWGRLIAAAGYSGAQIDPARIAIRLGDLLICDHGGRSAAFDEAAAHHYLSQPEFAVHIDLGLGSGVCRFWTCDLTREYVSINADYST
ncbi:MAG: bifunctional glutamate N-acetyltransferase/amino-acid acetyltransferase ArgJ [Acidobacteriaceae bacterium]